MFARVWLKAESQPREEQSLLNQQALHSHFVRMSAVLAVVLLIGPPALDAQSAANTGQIVGAVVDPTGAAMPRAEITARNVGTNHSRTVQSDSEGRYLIPFLPLGTYEVAVSASGFALNTQEVFLTLGSSITVNAQLSIEGPQRTD